LLKRQKNPVVPSNYEMWVYARCSKWVFLPGLKPETLSSEEFGPSNAPHRQLQALIERHFRKVPTIALKCYKCGPNFLCLRRQLNDSLRSIFTAPEKVNFQKNHFTLTTMEPWVQKGQNVKPI